VRYCAGFHWDLGSSEGSKFPRFGVKFGFGANFHWDPSSPESLQSIELIRVAIDCALAYVLGLPVLFLLQCKCGGCHGTYLNCHILACGGYYSELLQMCKIEVLGTNVVGSMLASTRLQYADTIISIVVADSSVVCQFESLHVYSC
jgi:hypothetical protein